MANNDWDITKPIDHTKIGDVPGAIRDVTSSAGIIIAKEHETPGTDNSGGRHLMGAVRVSLQSGTPTLDPEGNSLDTTATTDNGRLSVDTGASNELTVFVATSAGVSTSWNNVRVARVKADEDLDANAFSVKNLASGTQAGEAIHIGQVDTTASTGQLKLITPTTDAKIAVAVLDPPTEDGHVSSKKYTDNWSQVCRIWCDAAAVMTANAWTKIPHDTDDYDPDSISDLGNNRITPNKAGYYQVNAGCLVTSLTGPVVYRLAIYKNGVAVSQTDVQLTNSGNIGLVLSDIIYFDGSTDYVETFFNNGHSSNAGALSGLKINDFLSVVRVDT